MKHLADECLRNSQFSCWNKVSNAMKTPTSYSIQFPKAAKTGQGEDFEMWMVASNIVESVFNGKFTPVNSQWNAYYNPDKASPSWADKLTNTEKVGHHIVGTLKDQVQHAMNLKKADRLLAGQKPQVAQAKPTTANSEKVKSYTVKSGDTLYSIAGKNMAKVE